MVSVLIVAFWTLLQGFRLLGFIMSVDELIQFRAKNILVFTTDVIKKFPINFFYLFHT